MHRDDFAMLSNNIVYFDNGATTLKPKCVRDAICKYYDEYTANAHRGDYKTSAIVDNLYESTREEIKNFINAKENSEIVFTSGTTNGMNMIVMGFFKNYLKKDDEVLINKVDRNIETLKRYVNTIYFCLKQLNEYTFKHYNIKRDLPDNITFITSEELLKLYPTLDPSSRVNEYIKKVKALFVIGIGHKLSDGISQDGRAFDYDDWNLNGDLFVYNDLLDNALELTSMGIRVDKEAIINQAILSSNEDKLNLEYQQKIINEEVPFTLGGGIGQSRLCMFFLNKLHVGEVQSSYWDESTREFFLSKGITLL